MKEKSKHWKLINYKSEIIAIIKAKSMDEAYTKGVKIYGKAVCGVQKI